MGWLFGKKKPQVPFPSGRPLDEGALRLPGRIRGERTIEPDRIKAAAGLELPLPFPEEELESRDELPTPSSTSAFPQVKKKPLYLNVHIYQQLLGEMDTIKAKVAELQQLNQTLEASEYNEENNFTRLRRAVRAVHDQLLQIDKSLFKTP